MAKHNAQEIKRRRLRQAMFVGWKGPGAAPYPADKPQLGQLKTEMAARGHTGSLGSTWSKGKCEDWLQTNPRTFIPPEAGNALLGGDDDGGADADVGGDGQDDGDAAGGGGGGDADGGGGGGGGDAAAAAVSRRWNANATVRLAHIIVLTKAHFLLKDRSIRRDEKDCKAVRQEKRYWTIAAEKFNEDGLSR